MTFYGLPALSKDLFNRLAAQLHLPFLITDKLEDPSGLSPSHLEFLDASARNCFVENDSFTITFLNAYSQMLQSERRLQMALSLSSHRSIVQVKDLSGISDEEKKMVRHLKNVASKIDILFMKQIGSYEFLDHLNKDDPLTSTFFWRNHGPWPQESSSPLCNALPSFRRPTHAIFPPGATLSAEFFKKLEKDKSLSDPRTVVRYNDQEELIGIPYHTIYKEDMSEISQELDLAASAITKSEDEKALFNYLQAAADAFRTGNWEAADEKWVAMNMGNSKFAVRVAPDETDWAPGNLKAGFEFWLGLVNKEAVAFSERIEPFIQAMENHIHELVPQYPPRNVAFSVPDFIEMILYSGEHRQAGIPYLGQKLPNFTDKMSRMVVMTNFDNVPEKQATVDKIASLIFVEELANQFKADKSTTTSFLHEITHSLGVIASSFEIRDREGHVKLNEEGQPQTAKTALGGQNAQIVEELKAQTGALYWIGWLTDRGVFTKEMAKQLYYDCIYWAFRHIGTGMKNANGSPRTYSQIAAIQVRYLLNKEALTLENGKFSIDWDKLPAAITELFKEVIEIQVFGDQNKADFLRHDICDGEGFHAIRGSAIKDIFDQFPKYTYDLHITGIE